MGQGSALRQQLNFYALNQNKLIKMEKNQIKSDAEKIEKLEKLSDHYVREYQNNLSVHDKYIHELKKTFQKKQEFNNQYQKSSSLTQPTPSSSSPSTPPSSWTCSSRSSSRRRRRPTPRRSRRTCSRSTSTSRTKRAYF